MTGVFIGRETFEYRDRGMQREHQMKKEADVSKVFLLGLALGE